MTKVLQQVHVAAGVYHKFTIASTQPGPVDRLGLFGYRTSVLESEVIKPFVLCLLDPEEPPIPKAQLVKALDVVESWMVRRMLVRATTKSYSQVVAELVALVRKSDRGSVGDRIENHLARQSSASRYWPDDAELQEELGTLPAYRRLGRGRLRMVLEAVEDHLRGWKNGQSGLGEERVARGRLAIEHVMPRKWHNNWPLQDGRTEADRDRIIHSLGNLTLLTGKLNSKVSNGPWLGPEGKRSGLEGHDVLVLNRQLLKTAVEEWTEDSIRIRTQELAAVIAQVWPVPPDHKSSIRSVQPRLRKKIDLSDLINGGALQPGMSLFPRRKKYSHKVATLLQDGHVEVDGVAFSSASDAAEAIVGKRTNGWWFFLTDQASRHSLQRVRRDYVNAMAVDLEDDEPEDDGDEDEE
jgi:GNAT superfamily N-acetyltransferase